MGKPCPKHTAEFKRRAVQPCNERGTAYAEVLMCNKKWSEGTAVGILDQSGTGGEPHVQPGAEEARDRDLHQIRP